MAIVMQTLPRPRAQRADLRKTGVIYEGLSTRAANDLHLPSVPLWSMKNGDAIAASTSRTRFVERDRARDKSRLREARRRDESPQGPRFSRLSGGH
jgi:hypothetical protein